MENAGTGAEAPTGSPADRTRTRGGSLRSGPWRGSKSFSQGGPRAAGAMCGASDAGASRGVAIRLVSRAGWDGGRAWVLGRVRSLGASLPCNSRWGDQQERGKRLSGHPLIPGPAARGGHLRRPPLARPTPAPCRYLYRHQPEHPGEILIGRVECHRRAVPVLVFIAGVSDQRPGGWRGTGRRSRFPAVTAASCCP